ncbi:MAG: SIS domain-containing protein [Lachnospiraceae bacterium]
MNRQEYGNPLGNQVKSLPELVDEQVKRCFDEKKIQELISVAEIFDVRKIYITGAGDSIAAAGAFAEVIQKFAGVFHCEAIEPMEYTRFMTASDIGIGEPNSPLVIAISAGGGTARVREAILKTNELGAMSLLITNKKESASSAVAKKVFYLDVPPMEKDFPGLRSYFAGMIGLLALAARMGRVRNVLAPEKTEEIRQAICKYVHSWETEMERID